LFIFFPSRRLGDHVLPYRASPDRIPENRAEGNREKQSRSVRQADNAAMGEKGRFRMEIFCDSSLAKARFSG
jgi:hypothetical protein